MMNRYSVSYQGVTKYFTFVEEAKEYARFAASFLADDVTLYDSEQDKFLQF